jgi:hypothetical protein
MAGNPADVLAANFGKRASAQALSLGKLHLPRFAHLSTKGPFLPVAGALPERVEHPRQQLGGGPPAVVPHPEDGLPVSLRPTSRLSPPSAKRATSSRMFL